MAEEDLPDLVVKFKAQLEELIAGLAAGETSVKGFSDSVSRMSTKLKTDVGGAGKAVSDFDRLVTSNMKQGESAFTSLQRTIAETEKRVTSLKASFRAGGSGSVFGDLQSTSRDLAKLKTMMADLDLAPAGRKAAESYGHGLASTLLGLAPVLLPAIGGLAAGLFGATGIGIAAAIEHSNPQIVAAWKDNLAGIKDVMTQAAQPTVAPIADALSILGSGFKDDAAQIGQIFRELAPSIDPIAHGLVAFTTAITPGAVTLARDFTQALSSPAAQTAIADLGGSVSHLFAAVGENAPVLNDLVVGLSTLTNGVADLMDAFSALGIVLDPVFKLIGDHQQVVGAVAASIGAAVIATKALNLAQTTLGRIIPGVTTAISGEAVATDAEATAAGRAALSSRAGGAGGGVNGNTGVLGLLSNPYALAAALALGGGYLAYKGAQANTQATGQPLSTTFPLSFIAPGLNQAEIAAGNAAKQQFVSATGGFTGITAGAGNALVGPEQTLKSVVSQVNIGLLNQKDLFNQIGDTAATAIGKINALGDANLGLAEAKYGFGQALKQGGGFNQNTAKGLNEYSSLMQYQDALAQVYSAQLNLNTATQAGVQQYLGSEQALYKQAKAAGASDSELQPLLDTIDTLKGELSDLKKMDQIKMGIDIGVAITGAGAEILEAMFIGKLKGKAQNTLDRLGGTSAAAQSGVMGGLPHYDVTGIYAGGPAPLYRFAEQSTFQEALIARRGDRNRTLTTMATALSWLADGSPLVGSATMAPAASAAPVSYVPIVLQLGPAQLMAIQAALIPAAQYRGMRGTTSGTTFNGRPSV